jgi:hypothetical protein
MSFSVFTTSHFDKLSRKLDKYHPDYLEVLSEAIGILKSDPYNKTKKYRIKKLRGISSGDAQYRLSLGRWRFRYDIFEKKIVMHYCGLRRENTYN